MRKYRKPMRTFGFGLDEAAAFQKSLNTPRNVNPEMS
jgi:hypothetical protein